MLTILLFLPILSLILVLILPNSNNNLFKYINLTTTILQVLIVIGLYFAFDNNLAGFNSIEGFQFVEKVSWIGLQLGSLGSLQIDYFLGVDGISFTLVILTTMVMLIAAISSWNIQLKPKSYFALLLLLNSAIIGVFCALDFFLFYIFYELMLLPLFFLIGIWGGSKREYASIKFFLYTLFGSVFMLIVIIGLYFSVKDPISGAHTFNMLHMMNPDNYLPGSLLSVGSESGILFGAPTRLIAFAVLFLGFAIKVPVVPLHTWLPDAHVEAPTPISIILAGLLLKVGAYGIIRICYGIFPDGAIYFSYWIGLLGVISIIYGAFNALAATDFKRLIAYSSVSHMGFVLLGLASLTVEGINGAIFQLFSHGILASMLFFIVGVIYDRVGDRQVANFRGLMTQMPRYSFFVIIAFFASLGLPGFSAFIAELFVLIGAFTSQTTNGLVPHWMAVAGAFGILIGATYFLWTLQRMFFGQARFLGAETWAKQLIDLNTNEKLVLYPLALLTLLLGIFPNLLFDIGNTTINKMVDSTMQIGAQQLEQLKEIISNR